MSKIACSILKADFVNLSKTLDALEKGDVKWIHYDVMDNHFVPNLSFGPWILETISKKYNFFFDIHLMVNITGDVHSYLKPYLQKNVKQITIHREALNDKQITEVISFCKTNNLSFSISINPDTKIEEISKLYNDLDNILLMSVQPGFGGQKFNDIVFDKVKELNKLKIKNKYKYTLQIDGGVNGDNISNLFDRGVDWVVAGSWLTDNLDKLKDMVKDLV